MTVLDEQAIEIEGVGFAGVKGFMGGYGRGELAPVRRADRQGFRRRGDERSAQAGERAALAAHRTKRRGAALLADHRHAAKASREAIFQYLGSQRLADAIDRFDHVKAVVHGHAHHGKYEGRTPRGIPVYNVAQFVLKPMFGKPYVVLEI